MTTWELLLTMDKRIGATAFKATCLRIIERVRRDRERITITKRGIPIAVIHPFEETSQPVSIVGSMRGTVLRYDEPFAPATDPDDWDASR